MRQRAVEFSSDGLKCAADLYHPDEQKYPSPRPALVIGHGFSIVKEALAEQARYLAEAGYIVLAIDYRTFGVSEGEPRGQLFPLNEVEDFRNALTFLEGVPDVDNNRLGIWGVSFGGGIVLYTAAVDRRVKAVVAQSPVVNGRQWMRGLRSAEEWEELQDRLLEDRRKRFQSGEGSLVPVTAIARRGEFSAMPGDELAVSFVKAAEEAFKSYRAEILLESVERVIEFFPDHIIGQIAPRALRIVTNAGYDLHHPLELIQDAFARAREPKSLVLLPYDTVGLYAEPGLGEAMRHAIEWFDTHL